VLAVGRVPDVEIDTNTWTPTDEAHEFQHTANDAAIARAVRTAANDTRVVHRSRPRLEFLPRVSREAGHRCTKPSTATLSHEGGTSKRYQDEPSRALVLERPHQALDDGDAAEFADRSEPLLDPLAPTPASELLGRELRSLVGNEMVWRDSGGADGALEESWTALDDGSLVKTATPMMRREK
jgi:hypothetical protein